MCDKLSNFDCILCGCLMKPGVMLCDRCRAEIDALLHALIEKCQIEGVAEEIEMNMATLRDKRDAARFITADFSFRLRLYDLASERWGILLRGFRAGLKEM